MRAEDPSGSGHAAEQTGRGAQPWENGRFLHPHDPAKQLHGKDIRRERNSAMTVRIISKLKFVRQRRKEWMVDHACRRVSLAREGVLMIIIQEHVFVGVYSARK